ncbi:hypothetical protein N1032_27240, partial [Herbiconiux sp. CPCC 203386]|nr:hypothetical protein [Herbiconiux daphne]
NSKAPNAPVINVPVAPSHLIAQATPIAPKTPAVPSVQSQTPAAPAIPSHLVGSEVNVNIPHPAIKAVSGEDGSLATAQVFSPNVVEKEHVESAPAYIAPSAPAYKAPVATPAAVPSKLTQTPVAPVITPVLAPESKATPTAQHYKEPQNVAVPTVIAPQAAPESKAVPAAGHYKEPQNVAIPAQ